MGFLGDFVTLAKVAPKRGLTFARGNYQRLFVKEYTIPFVTKLGKDAG